MSDQRWMQDNFDVWNNGMILADVTNGGIVGFKYFGFGGLANDTKGIKAFAGTQKGDDTQLLVGIASKGKGAVRIRVMLDGPYANSTWNGKEIAVIEVAANAPKEVRYYNVPVPAVEGLTGKHAIYLKVEGEGKEGLVDIHGLGFAKNGQKLPSNTPKPLPQIQITIDGKQVAIPKNPVFSTNDNGFMDLSHYQVYAPLTDKSVIKANANGGNVEIKIGKIVDGRATVRCTYNGKEKIYLIN